MEQHGQYGTSRSLAVYGLLLKLYPRQYLQQHRAELLQNFEDLEQASQTTIALWRFTARDLIGSLGSQLVKTLSGQTAIVVIVLAVLFANTGRHTVARQHAVEGFCSGYILGWFAGWFGIRWQVSSVSRVPSRIRSLSAQLLILGSVLTIVIIAAGIFPGVPNHIVWASCYGFLLAWAAAWFGIHWQTRP